ncbi:MAG: hypothetical protein J5928_01920 [Firmicutes bacterium]|nr:hypothetical protein [Bacillota bacterium]
MINIEVLYPEVANLYGDAFNPQVLYRSYPDSINIIETHLNEKPAFASGNADFVFMGAMPEKYQELAISLLKPYRDAFSDYLETGRPALFTGNAFEIMGDYIEKDSGEHIETLGIYRGYAKRDMVNRYNSMYHGVFVDDKFGAGEIPIVGFKSQFTKLHGISDDAHLFKTIKERDQENSSIDEGIRVNNFMGTYLNGPLLIMNPGFTKYVLGILGIENPHVIYEDVMEYAYQKRLEDALNPSTSFAV